MRIAPSTSHLSVVSVITIESQSNSVCLYERGIRTKLDLDASASLKEGYDCQECYSS